MGLFVAIPLILFILLLLWIVPVGLWLQAIFSIGGGNVTILGLVGMRFRRVPPGVIVNGLIAAGRQALITYQPATLKYITWLVEMLIKLSMH